MSDTIILVIEWIDAWSGGKTTASENELFTISTGRRSGFCYDRNTPNEEPLLKACEEVPTMYLKGYRAAKRNASK